MIPIYKPYLPKNSLKYAHEALDSTWLAHGPYLEKVTEKLKELENRLEEAKKLNDVPIPSRIIENFPVPNVDSIPFIEVITGRNKSEGK